MPKSHRPTPAGRARQAVAWLVAITLAIGWQIARPVTAFADGPTSFSNSAAIAIPAAGSANQTGPASPYPSPITVSGLAGAVSHVSVRFNNLTHSTLNDVDAMLVAPSGENLVVLSDVGDPNTLAFASNATLTFDDAAATSVPTGNVPTGTYRRTNNNPAGGDSFPAPAPTPSDQTTLAGAFTGIDPNGTWRLYVVDDASGDTGTMAGGWTLTVTTEVEAAATTTALSSSDTTTTTGSPVTFTATVRAAGSPVTAGTVQFSSDGSNLGTPVNLSGAGTASLTTSALTEGTHLIRAVYSGASGFLTSNDTLSQRVDNPTTVTGTTYCNAGALTVSQVGPATPYPSNIFVSGVTGPITKVTAQVKGLSHAAPIDLDVLLSGPTASRNLFLMSDSGGQNPASNVNLTFDDEAASPIGSSLSSGTFRPTRTADESADAMPAPAPAFSGATALSTFDGQSPNGTWSLWVVDDATGDAGSIAGGWCLTITSAAPTSTALTATPNPSTVGQSVTFTATVSSGGDPVTEGAVQFSDGATDLGAPVAVGADGTATYTTSALTAGTHTITAGFGGTDTLQESSDTVEQVVDKVTSSTVLASSLNPSRVGDSVTFTATVTAAGNPVTEGSVQFSDGATELGAPVPVAADGTATVTTSALDAGSHTIAAAYAGTATFAQSSDDLEQAVDRHASQTSLASSLNPSRVGDTVTFTATVTSQAAPVTAGSVTFSVDGTDVSTVAVSGTGEASYVTSALTAGTHPVEARYLATASVAGSSADLDQVVGQLASTTTVTSSPNPADFGATVTLVATVTAGGAPVTTGTVQFSVDATPVGPALPVQADGTVTLTQAGLSPGVITFTATYSGTSEIEGSSGTVSQVINGRPTLTTLTGPSTSDFGEPVTLTAAVTADGVAVTAGSVVFSIDGTPVSGEVGVDGDGRAEFIVTDLAVGTHSVTATYANAGGDYLPSVSAPLSHQRTLTVLANGPYTVAEGGSLSLAGSGSSGADYDWDLNDDGVFGDAAGLAPALSWQQLEALGIDDGPATHTIRLRASSGGTVLGSAEATLTVTNTAPDSVLTGDLTATVGVPFTIKVGADDPSAADMAAMFTYTVDWGDGSPVESVVGPADPPVTHTYTAEGTFAATFTATDKDGGTGPGTTVQVVAAPRDNPSQSPSASPSVSPTPTGSPSSSVSPTPKPTAGPDDPDDNLPQTGSDADPNLLFVGLVLASVGSLVTVVGLIVQGGRRRG